MEDEHVVEEEQYKGCTAKLIQDTDPLHPRTDCDPAAKMICFHSRYDLGDKHELTVEEAEELMNRKDIIILMLNLYNHSGLTMSTSKDYPYNCKWDSGCVGFIYMDKKMIRETYGVQRVTRRIRERAFELMEGEVQTYDDYLTNNVVMFVAEDHDGENIETVGGFFGDESRKYAMEQCKDAIDVFKEGMKKDKNDKPLFVCPDCGFNTFTIGAKIKGTSKISAHIINHDDSFVTQLHEKLDEVNHREISLDEVTCETCSQDVTKAAAEFHKQVEVQ